MIHREERLNKTLREILGAIIAKELELPALTTITTIEVDSDLRAAKVKFSTIPSKNAKEVLKTLNNESGRLRSLLDKKIKIKSIPKLVFEIDHGPERAADIEKELLK